jgi:hypothetical protein
VVRRSCRTRDPADTETTSESSASSFEKVVIGQRGLWRERIENQNGKRRSVLLSYSHAGEISPEIIVQVTRLQRVQDDMINVILRLASVSR